MQQHWLKLAFDRKAKTLTILGISGGSRADAETVAIAEAPARASIGLFNVMEDETLFCKRLQAWLENRGLRRSESQRAMRDIGKLLADAMKGDGRVGQQKR